MTVIDVDQHLFERANLWQEYCDPAKRHLAVTIEPDELGYCWLTNRFLNRRIGYAWISVPEDGFASMGIPTEGWRLGKPSEIDYSRDLPEDYWNPSARVAKLDEFGIDKAMMISNWGLQWARGVADRLDVIRANLEAWNRWAVEVQQEGKGRLISVGHVTLRGADFGWLDEQLRLLARGGVKMAMINYGLIDGRRPSHPDHDRAWHMFVEHGIVPVFHIVDSDARASGLPEAWTEHDHDRFTPLLELVFCYVGIQATIADLALNGVFARHPELMFCLVEVAAGWLPGLLGNLGVNGTGLDMTYDMHYRLSGRHLTELELPPSEYVLRQVRMAPSLADDVKGLISQFGDIFLFGGDYPHCEGLRSPLEEYRQAVGPLPEQAAARLYGGTAAEMLGLTEATTPSGKPAGVAARQTAAAVGSTTGASWDPRSGVTS